MWCIGAYFLERESYRGILHVALYHEWLFIWVIISIRTWLYVRLAVISSGPLLAWSFFWHLQRLHTQIHASWPSISHNKHPNKAHDQPVGQRPSTHFLTKRLNIPRGELEDSLVAVVKRHIGGSAVWPRWRYVGDGQWRFLWLDLPCIEQRMLATIVYMCQNVH